MKYIAKRRIKDFYLLILTFLDIYGNYCSWRAIEPKILDEKYKIWKIPGAIKIINMMLFQSYY